MARWQGQHDQLMYCRRATHDQETARIIWQAGTLMRRVTSTPPSRNDKVVLTNSANQVCLNVPWIFSTRKKLIRTMPPNTDRPINRAMVVGCAVSGTRNHLKLHEPRTLKILFCNVHAKTRKLWKHFARAASTIEIATNIRSP